MAELDGRWRDTGAPVLRGLRPGLSRKEVARRFARVSLEPAGDLSAWFEWHDGAAGAGPEAEVMDDARFLSLEEALERRRFELDLAAENESPPNVTAAEIFDPAWFPLLSESSGRVYVVEGLGAGRVMIVDRESIGAHDEMSPSLIAFVDSLAREGLDFKPPPLTSEATTVVSRLESDKESERVNATNELTRKRPPDAFDALVAMLDSKLPQARRNAALILGILHDRRAVPILIRYMARWSRAGDVGASSAWAGLRDVSDEGVLAHLERALTEGDSALRLDAIEGLTFTRDARAFVMLQAAKSHDADPIVRAAAAEALSRYSADR